MYYQYSFDAILRDLNYQVDPRRNPLFDILLVTQDTPFSNDAISFGVGELEFVQQPIANTTAKFDITFEIAEIGEQALLKIEYDVTLFRKSSIERIAKIFGGLISHLSDYLRNSSIGNGAVVGILIEQNIEYIVGMMAVLKVGAAFLPIDPEIPNERIVLILSESNAAGLITTKAHLNQNDMASLVAALKSQPGKEKIKVFCLEPDMQITVSPVKMVCRDFILLEISTPCSSFFTKKSWSTELVSLSAPQHLLL